MPPNPPDALRTAMRQYSARRILGWAWQQCTPEERRLFRHAIGCACEGPVPVESPFRYTLGQRVQPYKRAWGTIIQRRVTERLIFGDIVEYLVEEDHDGAAWHYEPDVLAEGE